MKNVFCNRFNVDGHEGYGRGRVVMLHSVILDVLSGIAYCHGIKITYMAWHKVPVPT